jgi:hypothetical protein
MPSAQAGGPRKEREGPSGEQQENLIRGHVLRALGEPGGLGRVQVRSLWDNYYRVNVIVGDDPGCARIVRSYFLQTDAAGNVLESTPRIIREGQPAGGGGRTLDAGEIRR